MTVLSKVTGILSVLCLCVSCIKNDIPYPVVELSILSVEGTGFTCAPEDINSKDRVITLHLQETTDISKVNISSVTVTEGAVSDVSFPGEFDLRSELAVTLSLYQDYEWTIRAEQEIERYFKVEGQIGESEIDPVAKTARAFVPEETDFDNIRILELKLGPEGITEMYPSPDEITSFENFRTIDIMYHSFKETWTLFVEPTDIVIAMNVAEAWTKVMWLEATGQLGTSYGFRYRKQGTEEWKDVSGQNIELDGSIFKACVGNLSPETAYEVKAYTDDNESEITVLTTGPETALPNSAFEDWSLDGRITCPYLSADKAFWGTGNQGASMAGVTLTDKSTDTRPGSSGQYSAKLESKLAGVMGIGKLAAGNIFTGKYIATRGTNGLVGFGRPYTERPTALKGWFKYNCGQITDVGKQPSGKNIAVGDPDEGIIYVAVGTWTPEEYGMPVNESEMIGTAEIPICVDTRDVNSFFNPNSPAVIGYGEMVLDKTVGEWQEFTIRLDYNNLDIRPTHIVVVCTSSRYGDYFTGSRQSVLFVDDLELYYDKLEQ